MRFEHVIRALHLEALSPDDRERFEERDRALEDYVSAFTIVRELPGVLISDISPRYYIRNGGTLRWVHASINTTDPAAVTLTVYRNGSSIGTLTIAAGDNYVESAFRTEFATTDYLQYAFTGPGTTAADAAVGADFV